MRTTKLNRVLSLLLVLVMIMTLLPTAAFAADADTVSATKVTAAPQDWSGEYLLVYEDGGFAFDGSLANPDAVNDYKTVTLDNGKATAPAGISVTLEKVEGGYVMKTASGMYVYASSDKNMLSASANKDTAAKHPITLSVLEDGSTDIVCENAHMRFNNASNQMRFRFYNSAKYTNQQPVALYTLAADPYADIDKKYSVYEKVDSVSAGDTVVIYNAGNGMAMASETSGFYLAGASAEINSNGYMTVLPSKSQTIQWVVGVDADNSYTFTQGDKVL